jgi:HlyD family secretion protein
MKKYNFKTPESLDKWMANIKHKQWLLTAIGPLVILVIIFVFLWHGGDDKSNIISANGRIEATEIDISSRMPGPVKEILVHEGDYVKAGQVVAYMDTDVLQAQLTEAQGKLRQACNNIIISQSRLTQRKSEKIAAEAVLKQRDAELEVAKKRWERSLRLVSEGAASQQTADDDWVSYQSAISAKESSLAQIQAAEAVIETAKEEVTGAESAVEAAKGSLERIEANIRDSTLKAPRNGRIQYIVVHPGEVVAVGSPIISLVDLSDVYMTFFLSTEYAGRIAIGEEARLKLDATPKKIIPAFITYVSSKAQFTPKTVETASEREKFMFRVKAQIPPELIEKYVNYVKVGMPGMAYIRIDPKKPWPENLKVNI